MERERGERITFPPPASSSFRHDQRGMNVYGAPASQPASQGRHKSAEGSRGYFPPFFPVPFRAPRSPSSPIPRFRALLLASRREMNPRVLFPRGFISRQTSVRRRLRRRKSTMITNLQSTFTGSDATLIYVILIYAIIE